MHGSAIPPSKMAVIALTLVLQAYLTAVTSPGDEHPTVFTSLTIRKLPEM